MVGREKQQQAGENKGCRPWPSGGVGGGEGLTPCPRAIMTQVDLGNQDSGALACSSCCNLQAGLVDQDSPDLDSSQYYNSAQA